MTEVRFEPEGSEYKDTRPGSGPTVLPFPPPEEYARWNAHVELPLPASDFRIDTFWDCPIWRYLFKIPRAGRVRLHVATAAEQPVEVLVYPQSEYGRDYYRDRIDNQEEGYGLGKGVVAASLGCTLPYYLLEPIVHVPFTNESFTVEFSVEEGGMVFIEFFQTELDHGQLLVSAELLEEGAADGGGEGVVRDPSQFCYIAATHGVLEGHELNCREVYDTSTLTLLASSQSPLPISQRLTGEHGQWCRLSKTQVLSCWANLQRSAKGLTLLTLRLPLPDRRLGTLGFISQDPTTFYSPHLFYTYPSGELWGYRVWPVEPGSLVGRLRMLKAESQVTTAYAEEGPVELVDGVLISNGKHLVSLEREELEELHTDQTMHADLVYKHPCTLGPEPKCLDQTENWAVIDLPNTEEWVGGRSNRGWSCHADDDKKTKRQQDVDYAEAQQREWCQTKVLETLFPRSDDWPARTPTCLWNADGELFCFDFDEQRVDGAARITQLFGAGGAALGPIREVSVGRLHVCVLGEDGHVRCMGRNDNGELGLGTADDQLHLEPVDVVMPHDSPVEFIRTSADGRTCALHADDEVTCWGTYSEKTFSGPELVPFETMDRLEGAWVEE